MQVQATISLTPWAVVANWANLLVAGWTFRDTVDRRALAAWMLVTAVYSAAGLPAWRRWRRGRWPQHISTRPLGRAVRHAFVLALLWAVPVALVYPQTAPEHRPLVVGITIGMVCAGGFALFSIPAAAFGWVVLLSSGLAAAFAGTGEESQLLAATLLVSYAGIVIATVITSSRQLGGRLTAEAESTRQKRVVDMLLDDFQENARDWLWEIDADGRLQHVSPRLVDVLGHPAEELRGRRFVELLEAADGRGDAEKNAGAAQLGLALQSGNAFRDLHVSVVSGDQRRWFSLSGKRLIGDGGRMLGWRGVGTDVTRSRQQKADLVRLANVDVLTGLANRHQFRTSLDEAAGRPFTLFYLDLDNFKAVNDLHGHQVGDRVLGAVAGRFQGLVRAGDLLARIGGDEFALISWQALDSDGAAILATRLIDSLRSPLIIDAVTIRVGTSIGIVHAGPHQAPAQEMTRLADLALYDAKARGRNTYAFFHSSMEEAARRRNELIGDFHGAVERGEFELHYQALVSVTTGLP
ncbi:MAG: diguanylate cyclase, partial [Acidobacteria bacterium]|nr:diguanylate cyclase [Acidobacteriota bacterium]